MILGQGIAVFLRITTDQIGPYLCWDLLGLASKARLQ